MIEIVAGCCTKPVIFFVPQRGEIACGIRNKSWLPGFTTVWNRGKEGRIGFNQKPV